MKKEKFFDKRPQNSMHNMGNSTDSSALNQESAKKNQESSSDSSSTRSARSEIHLYTSSLCSSSISFRSNLGE